MTDRQHHASDSLAGSPRARQLAFLALRQMDQRDTYANLALERILKHADQPGEKNLATELVYGITRRCRTLDALITCFSNRSAEQQPPDLRRILQLGFYQLCFMDKIPAAVAIDSSVELARSNRLGQLTRVVNGILRAYWREQEKQPHDRITLHLQDLKPQKQLAIQESFPDWLVDLWWEELGEAGARDLCRWMNRVPTLDLRVNVLKISREVLQASLEEAGIITQVIAGTPSGLRFTEHVGDLQKIPGYPEGWWSVQDASAQQVSLLLDPQPGETIIDCCAAPGGKTTHIAELIQDQGQIWAFDRHAGRLQRVKHNAERLGLTSIHIKALDLLNGPEDPDLPGQRCADRVLLDAPCSGLGTLHRHADARWRQTPERITELVQLQAQLLDRASLWVKPGGILVYSTCTLHPLENEAQIQAFLQRFPEWQLLEDPVLIWPHLADQDGFFMAKLQYQ